MLRGRMKVCALMRQTPGDPPQLQCFRRKSPLCYCHGPKHTGAWADVSPAAEAPLTLCEQEEPLTVHIKAQLDQTSYLSVFWAKHRLTVV